MPVVVASSTIESMLSAITASSMPEMAVQGTVHDFRLPNDGSQYASIIGANSTLHAYGYVVMLKMPSSVYELRGARSAGSAPDTKAKDMPWIKYKPNRSRSSYGTRITGET